MDYLPGPEFRLILRNALALDGLGGEEIAVEIRGKRSSPIVGSGTNRRRSVGN